MKRITISLEHLPILSAYLHIGYDNFPLFISKFGMLQKKICMSLVMDLKRFRDQLMKMGTLLHSNKT